MSQAKGEAKEPPEGEKREDKGRDGEKHGEVKKERGGGGEVGERGGGKEGGGGGGGGEGGKVFCLFLHT